MPEHPSDGTSLRGLIEGTADKDRYIVTEWLSDLHNRPSHMVLKSGWKLMRPHDSAKKAKMGLYNLNNDPHELKNLVANRAGLEKYAAKLAELEVCYQEWMKQTNPNKV